MSLDDESLKIRDVFISYGRKESKLFASRLHDGLVAKGLKVWFDQNDIPLGVDYQNEIDDGIEKAQNFIFVIAPHAVASPYCRLEIDLAIRRHKRIIPVLHIEGFDFEKLHPLIGKINWIYMRESCLPNQPQIDYPAIDDFEKGFAGLCHLLENEKDYIYKHTKLLVKALEWERNKKTAAFLLTDQERVEADRWLRAEFKGRQAPTTPAPLQADFICESNKFVAEGMEDVYISHALEDSDWKEKIRLELALNGVSSWLESDIRAGAKLEEGINEGIEDASNLLFLISPASVTSERCSCHSRQNGSRKNASRIAFPLAVHSFRSGRFFAGHEPIAVIFGRTQRLLFSA
jgi:TIR domain